MDDIDFDFFEDDDAEEQTREVAHAHEPEPEEEPGEQPPTGAGPRVPPLLRLAGVVAGVILVIVLIVVLTGGSSTSASDARYMKALAGPAADSQQIGQELNTLLTQPSTGTQPDLHTRLTGLIQRQTQDTTQLQAITAPPRLRTEHRQAIEAFQFRLSGLSGLRDAFDAQGKATDTTALAALVAAQTERLLTSDVVWSVLFGKAARAQLRSDGATGVTVPASVFLQSTDLASPTALVDVVAGLQGAATGGGSTSGKAAVLKQGDKGTAVAAWQTLLNKWLKVAHPTQTPIATDGNFGPTTSQVTGQFQQAEGLAVDGAVGPATRAAMAKALASAGVSG
jgi:peptidoglycan hydrolase-like protein with peptidoglycan-binding domain